MSVSPTEEPTDLADTSKVVTDAGSAAESPPANEGSAADSPTAPEAVKETLVDRIKKAADVSTEKSPDSEGKDGTESDPNAKPEGEAAEEDKPFTKDDLKNLHSRSRRRVGKMIETMDAQSKELAVAVPAARQYQAVIGFLKDNDLTMDDANKAFDTLYAIRHDPARALEMLKPIYEQLLQATGSVLPQDLDTQVKQGYITEEHAKELARHRARDAQMQVQQTDQEQRAQRSQVEQQTKTVQSIEQSITAWESKWASSDPDYQKKRSEVQEQIELALSRAQRTKTLPKTPEQAVKLAEDCKKIVEAKYAKFQPAKREVQHVSGGAAVAATSQAKTLAERILQAANG